MDSIINLLENATGLQAKYRLMMVYFEENDTISALNTLAEIPDQFSLNDSQYAIHQHWNDFTNIMIAMKRDSITVTSLDSVQLAILSGLASFEEVPGALARDILHYVGIAQTGPYYLLPADQLKSGHVKPALITTSFPVKGTFLKIYPNPAKNYLVVEYALEDNLSCGLLTIYSPDGKLHFNKSLDGLKHDYVINTRNWNQGVYFFTFITQDNFEQSGKIVITK